MPEFLLIDLAAPMGSFGDLAGHERRGTAGWPGRSALLGLLGAAFGVRRHDAAGQAALDVWRTAVGVLRAGEPLRDFHTVQSVAGTVKRPNGRREALAAGRLRGAISTALTQRDYLCDCAFRVAFWGGRLEAAAAALGAPAFVPYLGRKSCPLAAPMNPRIVAADRPSAALSASDPAGDRAGWLPAGLRPVSIHSDPFEGGETGVPETRRDQPVDRRLWHFAPRTVFVIDPAAQG